MMPCVFRSKGLLFCFSSARKLQVTFKCLLLPRAKDVFLAQHIIQVVIQMKYILNNRLFTFTLTTVI